MILNREDLELSSVEISLMFYSYNCVCILSLLEVRIDSTRSFQNILSNEDWKSTFQSHDVLRLNDIWESLAFGSIPSIGWQKKLTNRKAEEFFFPLQSKSLWYKWKGLLNHTWISVNYVFFGLLCPKEGFKESCYKELENISLSFFISFWNVS